MLLDDAAVRQARTELLTKGRQGIERATAVTWAARAVAAYELLRGGRFRLALLSDAETYRQEAIEHASQLADEAFLTALRHEIDARRPRGLSG